MNISISSLGVSCFHVPPFVSAPARASLDDDESRRGQPRESLETRPRAPRSFAVADGRNILVTIILQLHTSFQEHLLARPSNAMWIAVRLVLAYLLGGVTFIPLVIAAGWVYLHLQEEEAKHQLIQANASSADEAASLKKKLEDADASSEKPPLLASQNASADLASRIPAGSRLRRPMELTVQVRRHFAPSKRVSRVHAAEEIVEGRGLEETLTAEDHHEQQDRAAAAATAAVGSPTSSAKDGMWSKFANLRQNVMRANSPGPAGAGVSTFLYLHGSVLYMWDGKAKQNSLGVINLENCLVDIVSPETISSLPDTPPLRDGEMFSKRNALRIRPQAAPIEKGAVAAGLAAVSLDALPTNKSDASPAAKRDVVESQPWFLSFKNNIDFEDWYHALLLRSATPTHVPTKPVPSISSIFSDEAMRDLISTLNGESEPLPIRWLNALVGRIWLSVHGTKTTREFAMQKLQKKLDRSPISNVGIETGLKVHTIDIGSTPPYFSKPMLKETAPDGTVSFEIKIHFKGRVVIEIGAFNGTLVLTVTLSSLEGNLVAKIKPAPSNRVWYSFTEKPTIKLEAVPKIYASTRGIGMFTNIIREQLIKAFHEALVLPFWDDVPFFDTSRLPIRAGIFDDEGKSEPERVQPSTGDSMVEPVPLTQRVGDTTSSTVDALDLGVDVPDTIESPLPLANGSTKGARPRKRSSLPAVAVGLDTPSEREELEAASQEIATKLEAKPVSPERIERAAATQSATRHGSSPSIDASSIKSTGSSSSRSTMIDRMLAARGTDRETLQAQASQLASKTRANWTGFVAKRRGDKGEEADPETKSTTSSTTTSLFNASNLTKSLAANKTALSDRLARATKAATAAPRGFNLATSLQQVIQRAAQDDPLGQRIRVALRLIQDVLDEFGEDKVAISFNGGKDCTVLIHLMAACLFARHQAQRRESVEAASSSSTMLYPPIPAIYITAPSPFPVLETFVESSAAIYNMHLVREGGGMKTALQTFLASGVGQGVQAVLVGTRRGDPHGATLQPRQATDSSWPQFLRVHPILDWSYGEVWEFLRELEVPYCKLYDEGYTSLGSTNDTHPNPYLRNPTAPSGFDPAYKLADGELERCGRGDPTRPTPSGPVRSQPAGVAGMMIPKVPARPNTIKSLSSSSDPAVVGDGGTSRSPPRLPPRGATTLDSTTTSPEVPTRASPSTPPSLPPRGARGLSRTGSFNVKAPPSGVAVDAVAVSESPPTTTTTTSQEMATRTAAEALKGVIKRDEEQLPRVEG